MREVIERLLVYTGLNSKQFSEKLGMQRPQILYDIVSGKTRRISEKLAIKILSVYPEINRVWLLTGEGEMLKNSSATSYQTWECPKGYQFKDENNNIINAKKIVLEKKKTEYPKTYADCCDVLRIPPLENDVEGYKWKLLAKLQELFIARDAYWKLYGEEMNLGKPWEPEDENTFSIFYDRQADEISRQDGYNGANSTFEFPTAKIRDQFHDNFGPDLEKIKKIL